MLIQSGFRQALRRLVRVPAVTATVVATLGLVLGATVSVFTVVEGVLLEELPYLHPEELYVLDTRVRADGEVPERTLYLELRQAEKLAGEARSIQSVASYRPGTFALRSGGEPVKVEGVEVTANLLDVMGVSPHVGTGFEAADGWLPSDHQVLLSHGIWQRRFGGDPAVTGRSISIDGHPHVVVGVAPEGFAFPRRGMEVWRSRPRSAMPIGSYEYLWALVRLEAGASPQRAAEETATILAEPIGVDPAGDAGAGGRPPVTLEGEPRLIGLREATVGSVRTPLLLLALAVGLVLTIAMVNLVNLMAARQARRGREVAIRRALGAGRGHMIRALLPESVLLALAGGLLGLGVATFLIRSSSSWLPWSLPRSEAVAVDGEVFLFTVGVSLVVGLVAGLVPALRSVSRQAGAGLVEVLRSGSSGGPREPLWQRVSIVGQVILAVIVVVGASLLVRSYTQLTAVDPGFEPADTAVLTVELDSSYAGAGPRRELFDRLIERIDTHPGVAAAGVVSFPPLTPSFAMQRAQVVGEPQARSLAVPQRTDPGYFEAAGLRLVEGAWISPQDHAVGAPVAVVNQAFVRRYVPGSQVLGRELLVGGQTVRVIGVVEDVRMLGLDAEGKPTFYTSYRWGDSAPDRLSLVVRSTGAPVDWATYLRGAVHALDPDLALDRVESLAGRLADSTARPRFYAGLLGVFAVLALLLAGGGVYALLAGRVAGQTREIGIRRSLGAMRRDLLRHLLREGLGTVLVGLVLGLASAALGSRLLTNLLFGIGGGDPFSYLVAAAVVLGIAGLAHWLPARRALRIDPMEALRHD